jgi:TrmH family RNA methyltransferase
MFTTITSAQNPRVKDAVRLRSGRGRAKQGRFIVDGVREVQRAVLAEIALDTVYLCAGQSDDRVLQMARSLASRGAEVLLVAPPIFEKLAYGDRNEGVVAVARTPHKDLESIGPAGPGPIVVLESVEKPGNIGAVLRTADAAGASAVVVADGATDLYNPNAIRASLGAVFSVPACAADSARTLDWLRRRRLPIYATFVGGDRSYTDVPLAGPCALVLGSESGGLSDVWRAPDITEIALPMLGVVDSLNVSAAAAVLLYEALRQRRERVTA